MKSLTNSQICHISGAGEIQDLIIGYYQHLYTDMFPAEREKALQPGLKTGSLIGSNTEKQIVSLSKTGADISGLVQAVLKKYQY
ncbi:MAG: hypothetical protein ABN478_06165 [Mixta sp.]